MAANSTKPTESAPSQPPAKREDNRTRFCDDPTITEWRRHTADGGGTGGTEPEPYVSFVKELLDAEEQRLATMESRGQSVITSSGTLVTLLLALAAVVAKLSDFRPPGLALVLLALAALAFLAAASAAIFTYLVPRSIWGLDPAQMTLELWERWDHPEDAPAEKVAATRLALWQATRDLTAYKARRLLLATGAQLLAVVLVTAAVIVILAAA